MIPSIYIHYLRPDLKMYFNFDQNLVFVILIVFTLIPLLLWKTVPYDCW